MVYTSKLARFDFEAVFVTAHVLPYAQYSPGVAWLPKEARRGKVQVAELQLNGGECRLPCVGASK